MPYTARRMRTRPVSVSRHYIDQIFRQLYRHLLLRIPSMYFTRVSRVFKDSGVSRRELKRFERDVRRERRRRREGYDHPGSHGYDEGGYSGGYNDDYGYSWQARLARLKPFEEKWADFVSTLINEWSTLNVVSVLLLS